MPPPWNVPWAVEESWSRWGAIEVVKGGENVQKRWMRLLRNISWFWSLDCTLHEVDATIYVSVFVTSKDVNIVKSESNTYDE